jgi:hypothetical protein
MTVHTQPVCASTAAECETAGHVEHGGVPRTGMRGMKRDRSAVCTLDTKRSAPPQFARTTMRGLLRSWRRGERSLRSLRRYA